ncbi:hypothetical protein D2Q93_07170 [Alicyclobacillaceae bacterium I2511]|nr:hypothetical protein D2Q93_07170 [Alicyclobacillaceae bacterium I2511]
MVLGILFATYVGIESYLIAAVGVVNQIPQLVGDGGGGILVALLCATAVVLVWLSPLASGLIFLLATVVSGLAGVIYQDNVTLFWMLGPIVLAIVNFTVYWSQRRQRQSGQWTESQG